MSSFALSTIIRSRNEPMTRPLTSWLVPSFSQHNVCLVVSGHCLHISVTNFQDKFVSLQQVNSPNGWDKFQICYTYMYLIRFLLNFAVLFLHVFWEFHGSVTAQNIRSPVWKLKGMKQKMLLHPPPHPWQVSSVMSNLFNIPTLGLR